MKFFKDFFTGIGLYGQALQILFTFRFVWFLIFPVVMALLLFLGGNWLVSILGGSFDQWVVPKLVALVEGISWLEWTSSAAGFLIRLMLRLMFFFFFVAFGGYLVLIVMSPVYSWLSERTEVHLTGRKYPFGFGRMLREVMHGILIALRNLLFQGLISIVLLFCSFIPVIGLFSPIALFFVSAYFYGFSFMDYAIERKRLNVKQSVRYVNRNFGIVVGIGTVFTLMLMIPWIKILMCSVVSLLAVIAGAVAVNDTIGEDCEEL